MPRFIIKKPKIHFTFHLKKLSLEETIQNQTWLNYHFFFEPFPYLETLNPLLFKKVKSPFSKYVVSISNYLGDDMTLHAFTKFSSLAKIYLAHCESKLL